MSRWQAVGNQHDLLIDGIGGRQVLPGQTQPMLDVGKVRWNVLFADILGTHVRFEANDRIMDRYRFRHHVDDFTRPTQFSEREHFDETQEITGILAGNQSLQGEPHSFDIRVLTVVPHGTAHVHDDHGCAFGTVLGLMHFQIVRSQSDWVFLGSLQHGVDDRLSGVEICDRVTKFVLFRRRQFDASIPDDTAFVAA